MLSAQGNLTRICQRRKKTSNDETKKCRSMSGNESISMSLIDSTAVKGDEESAAHSETTTSWRSVQKAVVVLDGCSVAREYKNSTPISSKAIKIALDYYWENGKPAVALLPRNVVDKRLEKKQADDISLLLRLHNIGRVAFVPAGTHDDYYVLQYATRENAHIVSNDRYRDHISFQASSKGKKRLERFLSTHLVPFTFVGNIFLPNPHPRHIGKLMQRGRLYHEFSYKERIEGEANKIKGTLKGE